jgi:UDP-N-acetylglucosamine 2-epimerase
LQSIIIKRLELKVLTVVGTRPEIIRLAETIKVLDANFEHVLVHTGQNYDYELNQVFFEDLGLRKPDYFLAAARETPIATVAAILTEIDILLESEKPDAFLVLGDTNSALSAYAAKRRHIPIFHLEAGNRSFDFRVPEEINRRIVDHISDINLTYSEHARRYLLAEGFPADRVIKVGSPMAEVIEKNAEKIDKSRVLVDLDLVEGDYIVVSAHREENVDRADRLRSLVACLQALVVAMNIDVIMSLHPRTAKRIESFGIELGPRIRAFKPFGFIDYLALQKGAACVLSDSGTITEEASILGIPAVTVRQAHERPEGVDEGAVIMADLNPTRVIRAVNLALAQHRDFGPSRLVPDYDVSQVSWKIAKVIASYTDFIRREVWKEGVA